MNPLLRILRMSGDGNIERPFPSLLLLGVLDFICLLEAADSVRAHEWKSAGIWAAIGITLSLVGYHWPRIRQRLRSRTVAKPDAVAVDPAPALPTGGRAEWLQLAKDFESCPKQVIAEWYRYGKPPIDQWQVGSWAQDDKCKSLCSLAGATLLGSPRVSAKLPEQVRSASEPMYRWLYFLKERRGLNDYMAGVESLDDGSKASVYAGRIVNLAEVSAAACIECAAIET